MTDPAPVPAGAPAKNLPGPRLPRRGISAEEWSRYLTAEIETLRRELEGMRAEQRELARSVDELTQTFRALALHLGIASEPYGGRSAGGRGGSAPPGFG